VARCKFLKAVLGIAMAGDRTVLFSTHITSDLERVADSVAGLASLMFWAFDLLPLAERLLSSAPFALAFYLVTAMLPAMTATNQVLRWTLCAERISPSTC